MKSIGIVRKLDPLGRITLPKELRKTLGIGEKDPVEIYVEGDSVVLKKYVVKTDVDKELDELIKTFDNKQKLIDFIKCFYAKDGAYDQ